MDNVYEMGYRGEIPWHQKGNRIEDEDSPSQIIEKCGFNFEIVHAPAGYMQGSEFKALEGRSILYRTDTGEPVSVMSKRFKVHQPREILGFFFDLSEQFGLKLETAGVLGRGERYWGLAKSEVTADLNGKEADPARLYALLATSVDGSLATVATPTGVRVVCANTWAIAMNGSKQAGTQSKQSHRSAFDPVAAAKGLGFDLEASASAWFNQVETIQRANKVAVSDSDATNFFVRLVNPDLRDNLNAVLARPTKKDGEVKLPRGFSSWMDAYKSAPGARPGTLRGLWEATTYYIDHERGSDKGRVSSAWFGQGAALKAEAWKMIEAAAA